MNDRARSLRVKLNYSARKNNQKKLHAVILSRGTTAVCWSFPLWVNGVYTGKCRSREYVRVDELDQLVESEGQPAEKEDTHHSHQHPDHLEAEESSVTVQGTRECPDNAGQCKNFLEKKENRRCGMMTRHHINICFISIQERI